ncbi:MAG: hypothetical protein ABJD11_07190 [Gemmatimonadota bacterium]
MSAVVQAHAGSDQTDVPSIVRGAVKLGLFESVIVLLFSLVSRHLNGLVEVTLESVILAIGVIGVIALPGLWTRARTIEGIAGAAGIGLAAAWIFLLVDVAILQPIGTYTHRWLDIGGGANWWYHPVWWMTGTFMSWMGAWVLAGQTASRGEPSVPMLVGLVAVFDVVFAAIAVVVHVPHAGWTVGTFGVAVLPALALSMIVTQLGARRR